MNKTKNYDIIITEYDVNEVNMKDKTVLYKISQGISVKDEEICRGDLVFFKGRNSRRSNVGHVGLVTEVYPDGRFKFIHASTSQGIREDWNFSPYYAQRYVGARRIYFVQIDKRLILDAILELEDIDDNTPFTETEKSITPQEFSTFVRAE